MLSPVLYCCTKAPRAMVPPGRGAPGDHFAAAGSAPSSVEAEPSSPQLRYRLQQSPRCDDVLGREGLKKTPIPSLPSLGGSAGGDGARSVARRAKQGAHSPRGLWRGRPHARSAPFFSSCSWERALPFHASAKGPHWARSPSSSSSPSTVDGKGSHHDLRVGARGKLSPWPCVCPGEGEEQAAGPRAGTGAG